MSEGVIGEQYKYVRYFKGNDNNELIYEELFDRQNDPHEVNNLADDKEYDMLKSELINRTEKLIEASQ